VTSAKASDYWIKQIEDDSRIIILNTGHVLLVDPIDAVYSTVWLPASPVSYQASPVIVLQGDNPV
jgi:hypothetical protein